MPATEFVRRNTGSGHYYLFKGKRVPSVTSVIGVLDKPALVAWAAKESANYAVSNWENLGRLDVAARLEAIKGARFQTNKAAVVKGNRVHAMAEQLQKGLAVDCPTEYLPQVEACARFLDEWQLETVLTETPLFNSSRLYAGTLDSVCRSPKLGMVLLDFKTGKGVYDEVALQLAAYKFADTILRSVETVGVRGGRKTETVTDVMPQIDFTGVAHVRDGSVEFHPVNTGRPVYYTFLAILEVFNRWTNRDKETDPTPLVGGIIYPENFPTERP